MKSGEGMGGVRRNLLSETKHGHLAVSFSCKELYETTKLKHLLNLVKQLTLSELAEPSFLLRQTSS